MKRILLSCIVILLLTGITETYGQTMIRNFSVTGVSLAGNKVNRIYIPPPKEFFDKQRQKGGAHFSVTFINCPDNVRTAISYSVSILEKILPPEVKPSIFVSYEKITTSGVLANSSTTYYIAGWSINAFKPYVYYPAALAEKIAGKPMNRSADADLILNINNTVNWYFGTDGKTPILKYDLVTVALHEICHGLGFMDSFRIDGANGVYGSNGIPLIYDTFIENQAGTLLSDTLSFVNPSTNLKTAITNNQVYLNGPLLAAYTSGIRARLYAPATYSDGSSIAHLDPTATSQANSLMAPFIDLGEAIHDPGKYTLSILGDLGWINTTITHEIPPDTEDHVSGIQLTATIKSDSTYNHNRVGVVYSYDNFIHKDTIYMYSPGSNNTYSISVPVSSYETTLRYYIFATDKFQRIFRYPSYIKKFSNSVFVGTDTVKPVVTHTPQKFYFNKVDSINIDALADDNLGLDTVYIEYKVNNGASAFKGMTYRKNFRFRGTFRPKALTLQGGDILQYRIVAIDKSGHANTRTLPSTGYFSVKIEGVNNVSAGYSTDFSGAAADFVYDGFTIGKPAGFSSNGLNTPHPYISPEETGDSIGYTATLRIPVKFDASGMIMNYKEVVLVEPGEDGYPFGTSDFYDYVIVEGSKNFGKSWFRLTDGYDSRFRELWLTAFKNSMNGNNSTSVGDESMLQSHTLFPAASSSIANGDTMMVRFRLFSDPYSNGWGWIIKDLHIGALINKIEAVTYSSMTAYPNPGNGRLTLRMADGATLKPTRFSVFNSAGICMLNGITEGGDEWHLDLRRFNSGIYLIVFQPESGIRTIKYTLIR